MPRRQIPFVPELHYHIYNRGNNRERIFFEPDNYLFFLKKIKEYLVPVADVLVYCLMPTHYHVVARVKQTSEAQTSEIFKISEVSGSSDVSAMVSKAMMKLS